MESFKDMLFVFEREKGTLLPSSWYILNLDFRNHIVLGLKPSFASYQLRDSGKITYPLQASVS